MDTNNEKFELNDPKLNNQIGQKMFAYIYDGAHLTENLKSKFKKSLIFLGKEGQIYNPLTATYVGIGTTAYTNLQKYAQYIEEKVDTLNQALTSSMVSAIYANIDKSEFANFGSAYSFVGTTDADGNLVKGSTESLKTLSEKIYATNELVLKGLGDYDPTTNAASLKEYFNIIDENLTDEQQKLLSNSYLVKSNVASPFATSGITVSLVKGKNKWRFNLKTEYVDVRENEVTLEKYVFLEGSDATKGSIKIEHDNVLLTSAEFAAMAANIKQYAGISEVFNAGNSDVVAKYMTEFKKYYEQAMDSVNKENQLFKNGKNSFVIDDKLTWSYIASSYAYTLDFAQKFTKNEVNRIYNEILGIENEGSLIPVDASVLRKVVADNSSFVYDENTKSFKANENDTDGMLWKTVLNSDTKFFKKVYFNTEALSESNTAYGSNTHKDAQNAADKNLNNTNKWDIRTSNIPLIPESGTLTEDITNALTTIGDITVYYNVKDAERGEGDGFEYNALQLQPWKKVSEAAAGKLYQGPENNEFGAEPSSDKTEDTKYNLNYFLLPVTKLEDVNDNHDYVVINNMGAAASHNINLADGINTLKEAAYVLDWITNGSLDPNNPEASGIEMAYSIAQNHIDIENLHARLVEVEGGKNVVNSISSSAANNKYVKLNWESNVTNVFDSANVQALANERNSIWNEVNYKFDCTFDNSNIYLMNVGDGSFEQVLPSTLLSYNALCEAYKNDRDKHGDGKNPVIENAIAQPNFVDHFNANGFAGLAEVKNIYEFTLAEIDSAADGKFAGHVQLGVDLNVATTYTMHQYGHGNDSEGYVFVPFKDIKKTLTLNIVLPKVVDSPLEGLLINNNRYASEADNITLDTVRAINSLLSKYNVELPLTNTNKFTDEYEYENGNVIVNISLDNDNKFDIFDTSLAKLDSYKYTAIATSSDAPYDGKLYKVGATNPFDVVNAGEELSETTKYAFRYSATDNNVKFASEHDAIATTEWVNAYTTHAINSLNGKFIDAQINTMNYVDDVINGLDSIASVPAGHVISNVKIENGKIQVESRELAQDKVVVDSVVWNGNGSDTSLEYTLIPNDIDTKGLLGSTLYSSYIVKENVDIFIQFGTKYIPYANSTNIEALVDINGTTTANTKAWDIFNDNTFVYGYVGNVYGAIKLANDEGASFRQDALRSLKLGKEYAKYIKVYQEVADYIRIDKADLTVENGKWTYQDASSEKHTNFYAQTEASESQKSVKYLDAEFVKHDIVNGGTGENTLHLTAHITKLQDASGTNSGFADAYDVKSTLSDIFEWVDLSIYDNPNSQNPEVEPTEAPSQGS